MRMKGNILFLMLAGMAALPLVSQDWPMWGGTTQRNMTSAMKNLPEFWGAKTGENIKWKDQIGSTSNGNPVVADGKISEIDMGNSVCGTPVPANGVLDIMTHSDLYAIAASAGGPAKQH
jgi:hypothetical protein